MPEIPPAASVESGSGRVARWAPLLVRVAGTTAVFAFIVHQVDISAVRGIFRSLPGWFWPAAVAVAAVQLALTTVRWQAIAIAQGTRLDTAAALRAVFVSVAINQCLPSFVGGDAYRVLIARRCGVKLTPAIHGVIIDRISALVVIVMLVLLSAPVLIARIPEGPVRYGFFAVLSAGIGLLLVLAVGSSMLGPLRRLSGFAALADLLDNAHGILFGGAAGLRVLGLAVAANLLGSSVLWIAALALGVNLSAGDCVMIVPWVLLTLTIPISIAGWGLREGAMVGALNLFHVDNETALALSILMGLVGVLCGLGGLVWWLASGEKPLEIMRGLAMDLKQKD